MAQYPTQPQQGVPTMQQPPMIRVNPHASRPGFAHHSQNRLGISQILCGMVVIVAAVVMIFFESAIYFMGYGIWTGVFFMAAGALGVSSAKSKNTCPIVGCLVMSIFSMMAATVVIGFSSIGLGIDAHSCRYRNRLYDYDIKDCEEGFGRKMNLTLQGVMCFTGLFEWIVALIQIIICSRALCCAPSQPGAVYYTATPQQVQMQGQYPQHAPQQPAYPQYPHYGQQPQYPPAHFPQGQYPPAYPEHRDMHYQAAYQGAPPMYPQLPQPYDDGRPPPYNPGVQGPSAPNFAEPYPAKQ